MSKTAPEPVEPGDDETEMEHFEKVVKGLLQVPKSEVDAARQRESQRSA